METVRTNIIWIDDVLATVIEESVECVICFSSDKVAYQVNVWETSKTMW